MAGRNVHDLEFREAKRPQASPSVSVGDLFRLDNRTVVSMVAPPPSPLPSWVTLTFGFSPKSPEPPASSASR